MIEPQPLPPTGLTRAFRHLGQRLIAVAALIALCAISASAGTNGTWIDATTGGLWSNPANWSGGTIANGTDAMADFSTLGITTYYAVHLDSSRTIGTLKFGGILPSSNWTLDNNGNSSNVLTLATSSGTPLIQVNNQSVMISAVLAGTQGFTESLGGTLVLAAANTLGGTVTQSSGPLQLANSNALQNSTVALNGFGATIAFSASIGTFTLGGLSGGSSIVGINLTDTGGRPVALRVGNDNTDTSYSGNLSGGGSLVKIGTGTLALSGTSSFSGGLTVSAGTLNLASAAAGSRTGPVTITGGKLRLSSAGALQNSAVTMNVDDGLAFSPSIGAFAIGALSGSGSFSLTDMSGTPIALGTGGPNATTYSGVMSGAGSLSESGNLTLSGANTFTGSTTVSAGTLQLNNSNALQYSTVIFPASFPGSLAFAPSISTFTLGGLAGGIVGHTIFTLPAGVTLQAGNNNADTTFSGTLNGSGSLVKVGSGTLSFNGFNNIPQPSGPVNIIAGRVQLAGNSALSTSTVAVNVDGGLTFGPGIGSFSLGGLSGAGNFSLTDTGGAPIVLSANGNGGTYSGVMSGAGSVDFGSGSLTLTGANTFSGSTSIVSGAVQLGIANALQNSTLVIGFNGTLTFSPSIGAFTVGGLSDTVFPVVSGYGNLSLTDINGSPVALTVGSNNASTTYSGKISGTGSLTKIGTGTLTLKGFDTFTGDTTITAGALQPSVSLQNSTVQVEVDGGLALTAPGFYSIGGLSGANRFTIPSGVTLDVGLNNADTTYSGSMSGGGSLVKVGGGTLTLSGANTLSGRTTVQSGTVKVTGSLGGNDSNTVFVSAGADFNGASIVRRVQAGASYAGLGSTGSGGAKSSLGSRADIRAGQAGGGAAYDVAMQWRLRNISDGPGLLSDVLNLTGMSTATGTDVQTDPFAFQITYKAALLGGNETTLAANGSIYLAWLNTTLNQPFGLWQNATTGNFGSGLPGDVFENVQSSWGAFSFAHSITDANVGNFLGSYGVDVAHHQVWAVLNHNSQFTVVPEPSGLLLIALGGAAAAGFANKRRKQRLRGTS